MKIMDLVLAGPVTDVSGTAESVRSLYLALFDLGIKVKLAELPGFSHIKADLDPVTREKIQNGFDRNDIQNPVAIHMYPPNPFTGPMNIQGVAANFSPILWRDMLNSQFFLENWVAAPFNIDAYVSQGVNKEKLRCIMHGVNTNKFNPDVKPMEINGKKPFALLTAMDWSVRKNPENMVTAFLQEFNNVPDACFIIKAYTGYADENSKQEIRSKIAKLRMMTRSNATILFISDFLNSEQMPHFHKLGDAWYNLSKGEGWDMGALQSMACGVPVIGSYNTAHEIYMTPENSYPVSCVKTPITNQEFLAKSPQFMGHNWFEPNLKEARKQMRQAYNDWKSGDIKKKGELARATALDYSWKKTALQVVFHVGKYFN